MVKERVKQKTKSLEESRFLVIRAEGYDPSHIDKKAARLPESETTRCPTSQKRPDKTRTPTAIREENGGKIRVQCVCEACIKIK